MLEDLHIQHLALVEDAWLRFSPGLNVLTGETGAGKTVLLSALKLLLGQRGEAALIEAGAEELKVEGTFYFDDDEVIVSRSLNAAGRNKCVLNGTLVPVKSLADELASRVDLYGQHDHQALLKPAKHLELFDAFTGEPARVALEAYTEARSAYEDARAHLDELIARSRSDHAQFEANRLVLQEIERVNPLEHEDDELRSQLPALMHAEELAEASGEAWQLLTGEGGVSEGIARALSGIERVLSYDPSLKPAHAQLSALLIEAQELGATMRDHAQQLEHDPARLDEVQTRLRDLESLSRRFGPSLDEVIRKRDELEALIDSVDNAEEHISAAQKRCDELEAAYRHAAEVLHETRVQSAQRFEEQMKDSLRDLALAHASISVSLQPLPFEQWTARSSDRVEFLYAPAKQAPLRPLAKIASGGEISRVMLALKSLLGRSGSVSILVFDEIDAGIGGATATAVAQRLSALAKTHQVIVITHLAQVAVFGQTHMVVEKTEDNGRVGTQVRVVSGEERTAEIARLLSGEVTELSLAHANELLESARA